jgi:cytoskeletal protein CcmA (bactofilin family)
MGQRRRYPFARLVPTFVMEATMGNGAATATLERRTVVRAEPGVATLGRSVVIKGDLTGSEDLIIDGRVEGRIDLPDHSLTIGPDAHIEAEVVAKAVIVLGSVTGRIMASHKVEIRDGGSVDGGAYFRGKVDMGTRSHVSPASESDR